LSGSQEGDPEKAAKAIIETVNMENPPLHPLPRQPHMTAPWPNWASLKMKIYHKNS